MTFFSSLSCDDLRNIIVWVHIRDYDEQALDLLRFLFHDASPFHSIRSTLFQELHIDVGDGISSLDLGDSTITINVQELNCTLGGSELIWKLVDNLGSSVTYIKYDFDEEAKDVGITTALEIAHVIVRHYRNVKEIGVFVPPGLPTIPPIVGLLLEKCGPQLSLLQFNNCTRPTMEFPSTNSCTNLKRFHFAYGHCNVLMPLLETIGAGLEELGLARVLGERILDLFDIIERKCRNLSVIRVRTSFRELGEDRYTSFLCSFGEQLIEATVYKVGLENIRKLTSSCKNLRTWSSFTEFEGDISWDRVEMLGPHLRSLRVHGVSGSAEKCMKAMGRCLDLQDLDIWREPADHDVNVLFSNAILQPLEFLRFSGLSPTKSNVALIASTTAKLRALTLSLVSPIDNSDVFDCIVRSNAQLVEVDIQEDFEFAHQRSTREALEIMRCLLRTFAKCRSVQLSIRCVEGGEVEERSLRDLCGWVPCRGINLYVRVGSTRYEQLGWHGKVETELDSTLIDRRQYPYGT